MLPILKLFSRRINVLWYRCSSGIMLICYTTMRFTVEYWHLIKSCETAEIMVPHACIQCFLRKLERLWTKNSEKKVVSTGTIEWLLLSSGHPQQTNMYFSCRSYLIIVSWSQRYVVRCVLCYWVCGFASCSSAKPLTFCVLASIYLQQ